MTTYNRIRDRILGELDAADPNWDLKYDSEYEAAEALGLSDLLRQMEVADAEDIEELDFNNEANAADAQWWREQNDEEIADA